MGSLFKDSFDIGAGATLGNIAAETGYQVTENLLNAAEKGLYTKYRVENFDPIVRQDLMDMMVRGELQSKDYPFPQDIKKKKENFFKRHKVFTGLSCTMFIFQFLLPFIDFDMAGVMAMWLSGALMICVVGIVFNKLKRGGKKLVEGSYKPKLMNDGQQYWYIREYVRQALAAGQITLKDAIIKISNTELGRQFPDTIEEIEANAFYYQQRLGSEFHGIL